MRTVRSIDSMIGGNIYRSLDISASGLTTQRMRMDAIASNIANASTTNADGAGNPYLRRHVQMSTNPGKRFAEILGDETMKLRRTKSDHISPSGTPKRVEMAPLVAGTEIEIPNMKKNVIYDPTHPDADADGYVTMPDINVLDEMADLMIAQRSYEANVTVINAAKSMITKSLEI